MITRRNITSFILFFFFLNASNSLTLQELSNDENNLENLYSKLLKKQETAKTQKIVGYISKAVPYGIDKALPALAEYETFKSDKTANFLSDGNGRVVFRQFRRIRISDVLGAINNRRFLI